MADIHSTYVQKNIGPISLVYALREGLSVVVQEGIENVVRQSHFLFQFRQYMLLSINL